MNLTQILKHNKSLSLGMGIAIQDNRFSSGWSDAWQHKEFTQ